MCAVSVYCLVTSALGIESQFIFLRVFTQVFKVVVGIYCKCVVRVKLDCSLEAWMPGESEGASNL